MTKTILTILGIFLSIALHAQQPQYASVKLDTKADYTAEVDKLALQGADQILSGPPALTAEQKEVNAFLIRWMSGTPTYSFVIDEQVMKMLKGKDELLFPFMASMVKFSLEHPAESKDQKKIKAGAVLTLLDYCRQQQISLNKQLRKLEEAKEKGNLEHHLN